MGFLNVEEAKARQVKQAEDEVNAAIEAERPEQIGAELADKDKKVEEKPVTPPGQTHDYEKRWRDLQSYIDKKLKPEHKAAVEGLEKQVNDLKAKVENLIRSGSPTNLPETVEEIEALKKESPTAYAAIMRLAEDVADKLFEEKVSTLRGDVEEIKKARKQSVEEAAYVALQKRNPDIDISSLEHDDDFITWITGKSQRIQDAMFKNKEDVDAASDVLSLYRYEVLSKKSQPAKKQEPNPAAREVAPKGAPPVPSGDSGWDFTESQLEEMDKKDPRWFERNSDKIQEAMNKGRILLDITDPIGSSRRAAARGF